MFLATSPYNMYDECAERQCMGNEMGNETVEKRDTDAMKSRAHHSPNSQYNSLQFRLKNPVHTVKQQNDRAARSQTKDGLRFAVHGVAHFPDGCVCLWIRGLFQFQHFGAAQGGPFPWFKPEIPPCCPSTQDCQSHCQHSIPLFHSCNWSVAIQRVRSKSEGKKMPATVVTRILMIVV